MRSLRQGLVLLGPGLLLAATGVGAGDLATAALAGSQLGASVLWAVIFGAALKFVLNEGLARWQLLSGQSFLDGVAQHLGRFWLWLFLPYLLLWSYFVGAALISACGIAAQALWPLAQDAASGQRSWGALHALAGLLMIHFGGFALFVQIMRLCIALMFVVVLITALQLWPGAAVLIDGLQPRLPADRAGLNWTLALIGGVGGTLTVLCYGYWIQEAGRQGAGALRLCRIDLAVGYAMTALFGLAMVIIGSQVPVSGGGARLIIELGAALERELGGLMRWVFLVGAWGALFSSLLGVWQAVPYLFADVWRVLRHRRRPVSTRDPAYRVFLLLLALVPLLGIAQPFARIQLMYAISGALFMPALALALLALNRQARLGREGNGALAKAMLLLALAVFAVLGAWRWLGS